MVTSTPDTSAGARRGADAAVPGVRGAAIGARPSVGVSLAGPGSVVTTSEGIGESAPGSSTAGAPGVRVRVATPGARVSAAAGGAATDLAVDPLLLGDANPSSQLRLSSGVTGPLAAERLHADDTTVPILAKGKTTTGRIWTYVRDDRPFGGPDPPAALFYASRDRSGQHPERHLSGFGGILQADAYGGYNGLHGSDRPAGAVTPAFCWSHARRKFFELADIAGNARRGRMAAMISPIALDAVRRIDALFTIERGINGLSAPERLDTRRRESAPLVAEFETWLRDQRSRLSRSSSVTEPIDYMLRRWPAFARFLDDGRICLSNNAAERALRGFALGRKAWLFAGSDRGAERAALIATLIMTAKLNDVDPQAWLADVLARIAGHPVQRLNELLPWSWRTLLSGSVEVDHAA